MKVAFEGIVSCEVVSASQWINDATCHGPDGPRRQLCTRQTPVIKYGQLRGHGQLLNVMPASLELSTLA